MGRPILTVVIGANGAGKSTWCREHPDNLPDDFYDADSIAQGLGSYNAPEHQLAARRIVDEQIESHLENRDSFGFESTYSGRSRPEYVRRAHTRGYAVNAFFLGTHNSQINVRRVINRVAAKTGHFVEESEVKRRWDDAQKNLVRTGALFDRISVIDSSTATTAVVVEFSGESITPQRSRDLSGWHNCPRRFVRPAKPQWSLGPRPDSGLAPISTAPPRPKGELALALPSPPGLRSAGTIAVIGSAVDKAGLVE